MALIDTHTSIAAVTSWVTKRLSSTTNLSVYANHPKVVLETLKNADGTVKEGIGIFLYEASFDGSMKNISLHDDHPAPLWLVLKYLITAFDIHSFAQNGTNEHESFISDDMEWADEGPNTVRAHNYLGIAAAALQSMNFLEIPPEGSMEENIRASLLANPEELKITFDEVNADLISKIIQSSNMDYCFSLGFQVRPVLIAPQEPPSPQFLVGIDYTNDLKEIGDAGIQIDLETLPVAYPEITSVEPPLLPPPAPDPPPGPSEPQLPFVVHGKNLNAPGLGLFLDDKTISIVEQSFDQITADFSGIEGYPISAGSYSLKAIQEISENKKRSSAPYTVHVLPVIIGYAKTTMPNPDSDEPPEVPALSINGVHLGDEGDDIVVVVYEVTLNENLEIISIENDSPVTWEKPTIDTAQEQISVQASVLDDAKSYLIVVQVNGESSLQKPVFMWGDL